jgi:DNA gyrase subunit B
MYIGPLDAPEATLRMVEQVMCASLDEAVAGRCSRIAITLHDERTVTVEDDGPGMSIDYHPKYQKRTAELLMTVLAACRAMRESAEVGKRFCGLGIVVTNALSERCDLQIKRDGKIWQQTYRRGYPTTKMRATGRTQATGTRLTFTLDRNIFRTRLFDAAELRVWLASIVDELGFATAIELIDKRENH